MYQSIKCLLAAFGLLASLSLFAQHPNEDCSGAIPLPDNPPGVPCQNYASGSTLFAGASTPDCNGNLNTHDLWYSFVPIGNSYRLEVIINAPWYATDSQYGFQLYNGDCNSPASFYCKTGQEAYGVHLLSGLVPGQTCYLKIFSTEVDNVDFNICGIQTPEPPANTACATAVELLPDATGQETCVAATTAGIIAAENSLCVADARSVWYRFTAVSTVHTVKISDLQIAYGIPYSFGVAFYSGEDCSSLDCMTIGETNLFLSGLTPGKTYFIQCFSKNATAHKFNLCLGTIPLPNNDDCASATVAPVTAGGSCSSFVNGSTAAATPGYGVCSNGYKDVWYKFTATQGAHNLAVSDVLDAENGTPQSASLELWRGGCDDASLVTCYITNVYNNSPFLLGDLVEGNTYWVRVAQSNSRPINFNICVSTPPPPPANDACVNAITLVPKPGNVCFPTTGATVNATNGQGPIPFYQDAGDVWYKFTATQANHDVQVSNIIGYFNYSNTARVELYTNDCATFEMLAGNILFSGEKAHYTTLTPGNTYYIRVTQYPIFFNICVSAPPPPVNDNCAGALPLPVATDLSCTQPLQASLLGATPSGTGCYGANNDLWYKFTATSGMYRFNCSIDPSESAIYGFEVFSGNCGSLTSLLCSGNFDLLDGMIPGAEYYIRVFAGANTAPNTILCTQAMPAPPNNDGCTNATVLTPQPDFTCTAPAQGTTLGAFTTPGIYNCAAQTPRGVWYTFTATAFSHLLEINVTKEYFNGGAGVDFVVFEGDCGQLSQVACQYNSYHHAYVIHRLTPGKQYFIHVGSEFYQANDFDICLKTLSPPPANDDCSEAAEVFPNDGYTCDLVYSGTTFGATFGLEYSTPGVWYTFTATSTSHLFEFQQYYQTLGEPSSLVGNIYEAADCQNLVGVGSFDNESKSLPLVLVPGKKYYIRISPTNAQAAYNFTFCIKTLPLSPANEGCSGAIEVASNVDNSCALYTEGSTFGAIQGGSGCSLGNDVWYKFTALTQTYEIQFFNISRMTGNDDLIVEVMTGPDCDHLAGITCSYPPNLIALTSLTIGQTYYLKVLSPLGSAHNFDLCVNAIAPPDNDDCATATVLEPSSNMYCNNYTYGTTFGATSQVPAASACNLYGQDVWYAFTATSSTHLVNFYNIQYTFDPGGWNYGPQVIGVELYHGGCNNLELIGCHTYYNNGQLEENNLIPGETYYVRVFDLDLPLNYQICVTSRDDLPNNDICAVATTLPVSPDDGCLANTEGTLNGAFQSTGTVPGVEPLGYNDVWYKFTALQADQKIYVKSVSIFAANVMAQVYAGDCNGLTLIAELPGPYWYWIYLTHLTPGQTYYLRVYSNYQSSSPFNVCVTSPQAPAHDECAGAMEIPMNNDLFCGNRAYADSYGATQSLPGCSAAEENDIWLYFTATTESHRLSLDVSSNYNGPQGYAMEIWEGDCGSLTPFMPCAALDGNTGLNLHGLTPGNRYNIRLSVPKNQYLWFAACVTTPPPAPDNDDCAAAIPVDVNTDDQCTYNYNGTTLSATQSAAGCNGEAVEDVWYQFVASSESVLVNLTTIELIYGNAYELPGMEVLSGNDCSALTSISCTANGAYDPLLVHGLTIGQTYFIRIFCKVETAYRFNLCLRAMPAAPTNLTCANAIVVEPSPNMDCTAPVTGYVTNLNNPLLQYSCNVDAPGLWYRFVATNTSHLIQLDDTLHLYGYGFLGIELYDYCTDYQQPILCIPYSLSMYASNLTPGQEYYIRIAGYIGSGARFRLCVLTPDTPANDDCANAQPVPVSPDQQCIAPASGTTFGASQEINSPSCGTAAYTVWYSFVATSDQHTVAFTDKNPGSVGYTNTYYRLFDDDCGGFNATDCYSLLGARTFQNLIPGKTYYLKVGTSGGLWADFDLCITTPRVDLAIDYAGFYNNCAAGSNESAYLQFHNNGNREFQPGTASITLTLTGANEGVYGPFVITNYNTFMVFNGLDLSNTGPSDALFSIHYDEEVNPADNSLLLLYDNHALFTAYYDTDGDGYGNPGSPVSVCELTTGLVDNDDDCNDFNPTVHPGGIEICNGEDDNCNGYLDAEDLELVDQEPPTITCPADVTTDNDPGACGYTFYYPLDVQDNCTYTVDQAQGLPSGAVFPIGATVNAFTVTDAGGNSASCSFTVLVNKTADPELLSAYTILANKDVFMKNNTVQSGGVGILLADKKVRLQSNTQVVSTNTFVKAPVLELQTGATVSTSYTGVVDGSLLPPFQANATPGVNNLTIPNNSAPQVLALGNYGTITVGINSTVVFSGQSTVRIKELILKNGAVVQFAQNTDVLINKGVTVGPGAKINAGNPHSIRFFAGENVNIDKNVTITCFLYTLKELRLAASSVAAPTIMTGLFVADLVYSQDNVLWNRDEIACWDDPGSNRWAQIDRSEVVSIPVDGITVMPNPAYLDATVGFDLDKETDGVLQLLDANGVLTLEMPVSGRPGNNQVTLKLGSVSQGVYLLRLRTRDRVRTTPLVVVRP